MATRQTKAERDLQALRDAQVDSDPNNDPTLEQVREAEAAVVERGRRPEDIVPDDTDERNAQRIAETVPNPDGLWLAPVDDRGRLLVTLPTIPDPDAPDQALTVDDGARGETITEQSSEGTDPAAEAATGDGAT